jgi:branched-chain amino acid transport system ATP-binding protein
MSESHERILTLTGVHAGYGDIVAARDVSFALDPGEVFALLGRNGAGKSTVLKAISGLCRVHSGEVTFLGDSIATIPTYGRVAAGLGFVQEGKRVFRQRTVEENLALGAHTLNVKRSAMNDLLDKAYSRFPILGDRRNTMAGSLSGGQQQMLAIAVALVPDPKLLMLDEPSAGLAPSIVGDVLEVVAGLRDSGLTVLLVEQSVEFALAVADRVAVLDLGRLVLVDDASQPNIRSEIRTAYLGTAQRSS